MKRAIDMTKVTTSPQSTDADWDEILLLQDDWEKWTCHSKTFVPTPVLTVSETFSQSSHVTWKKICTLLNQKQELRSMPKMHL